MADHSSPDPGHPAQSPSHPSRVRLGRTELWVPRLCQGTAFRHLPRHADSPEAEAVLRHCLEVGLTFFDSAIAYGWGGSEELLGRVVAGRRTEAVICTKVPASRPAAPGETAGTAARFTGDYLRTELEGSLRRLRTDWVDLYLLHQPDGQTPAVEVCAALDGLVRAGMVRYWGLSNHPAPFVAEACALAAEAGSSPPALVEDYYNVAGHGLDSTGRARVRRLEEEMFPVLRRRGLGLLAFSPMDTGQLAPQHHPEPGSPLERLTRGLDQVAGQLGATRAQVCLAWVLAHPEVSSVLAGPESPAHVDELLAGTSLVLPAEALEQLTQASATYTRQLEAQHRAASPPSA
ncbi:MAG: aldo/keto reductase [Candidatus Latescibacterota bacterium]